MELTSELYEQAEELARGGDEHALRLMTALDLRNLELNDAQRITEARRKDYVAAEEALANYVTRKGATTA